MKMQGIPIGVLDKETLKKLGMDGIDSHVIALSRVLNSLVSVQKDDAIWVLKKALEMVDDTPKEEPQNYTELVIEKVSRRFGFLPQDLVAKGRSLDLVMARQVVMYVLWCYDRLTLEQIGKALGGRTPATISWGVQKISKVLISKPEIASLVKEFQPSDM